MTIRQMTMKVICTLEEELPCTMTSKKVFLERREGRKFESTNVSGKQRGDSVVKCELRNTMCDGNNRVPG